MGRRRDAISCPGASAIAANIRRASLSNPAALRRLRENGALISK